VQIAGRRVGNHPQTPTDQQPKLREFRGEFFLQISFYEQEVFLSRLILATRKRFGVRKWVQGNAFGFGRS